MNDRDTGFYMYCNLMKQGFEWMHAFKDAKEEIRKEVKYTYKKNKKLIEKIEAALGPDLQEKYWEDSEIFSKCLEYIRNAKTKHEKETILLLIKEFVNGDLKIIEDGRTNEVLDNNS